MKDLSLEYRVRKLERLVLESKRDQEVLQKFLGDDYYSKYNSIKNKINDHEFKDIYRLIKKDPAEVKQYIDSIQSNRDIRTAEKTDGAELIYNKDGWKVYRITTYQAARLYGSGTKWCITGRYAGHEERGEEYFYNYINDYNLDGGYYFYIHGNDKYCILKKEDGSVVDIYNAADDSITESDLYQIEPDFPKVPGIILDVNGKLLYSDNIDDVKKAVVMGVDINLKHGDYPVTPLRYHCANGNANIVRLLLGSGADPNIQGPIMSAILRHDNDILKMLIDAGADVNILQNVKMSTGYISVLGLAINQAARLPNKQSERCVALLLEHGADPNAKVGKGSAPTPIWYAIEEITRDNTVRYNIVNALLKAGANCKRKRAGETLIDRLDRMANKFGDVQDTQLIELLSEYM